MILLGSLLDDELDDVNDGAVVVEEKANGNGGISSNLIRRGVVAVGISTFVVIDLGLRFNCMHGNGLELRRDGGYVLDDTAGPRVTERFAGKNIGTGAAVPIIILRALFASGVGGGDSDDDA